jgi:hypothetical protein
MAKKVGTGNRINVTRAKKYMSLLFDKSAKLIKTKRLSQLRQPFLKK